MIMCFGFLGADSPEVIDPLLYVDQSLWFEMSDAEQDWFVLGYMTGAQSWHVGFSRTDVAQWPNVFERLRGPVPYSMDQILSYVTRQYEAGNYEPFSVVILGLK
jgi:hypothetical protein